mgnify:CR=1 FL=1
MGNLDDAIAELKAINSRLAEMSELIQARERKSEESLNTIRKDLWNIKNIVADENILHHSVLTPMLNIGLLTPKQIIEKTIQFSEKINIPLNSLEGFIRQIIGWREFIRGVYHYKGSKERTCNFWKFSKSIPSSFYDGTTGIEPIDNTIKKILQTGYCHHIERLMILGNFICCSQIFCSI